MKSVVFALLLMPTLGFSATLSGSIADSTAAVALPAVGTVDWSQWARGTNKAGIISPIVAIGWPETYWNPQRIVSGDSGTSDKASMRVTGAPGSLSFTVPATSAERTLLYYIGGWNSSGRVTVSLPGAATYTAEFNYRKAYSSVVTIRFSGAEGTKLTVNHQQTGGAGDIFAQGAALQGASGSPPAQVANPPAQPSAPAAPANNGSAVLAWSAPTQDTNGSALRNLSGYRVYWYPANGSPSSSTSATINNTWTTSHTVTGLSRGTYYFVMTALASTGEESEHSNTVSKWID